MILAYLSPENLRSNAFVKEFCFHFKPNGRAVVLHGPFGSAADTRFVSKRISAYLSEELVVNTVLNGDQRGLVSPEGVVKSERIETAFAQVRLVIMNALAVGGGAESAHVDPIRVMRSLQGAYPDAETLVFPCNPKSPLAVSPLRILPGGDLGKLLGAYEEEAAALHAAAALAPATLVLPSNCMAPA